MQPLLHDRPPVPGLTSTPVCACASRIETSHAFARMAQIGEADEVCGGKNQVVTLLDDHLVQCEGACDQDTRAHSGLNYDETPLQLCLALRPSGNGWRALIDPAIAVGSPEGRFDESKRLLARSLRQAGAAVYQSDFDRLIAFQGPDNGLSASDFEYGVFWIGAEVNGAGRSIYIDASVGEANTYWARALNTLTSVSTSPGEIPHVIMALSEHSIPMSVGMEVRGHRRRLKLHTRLTHRPPPHILGQTLPMLSAGEVAASIGILMKESGTLSLHGFVLEAAFDAETGMLCDAKIDIAAPEVCRQKHSWNKIREIADMLGVIWPEETIEHMADNARLAYIGIGKNKEAQSRLNLYFTPREHHA